MPRPANGAYNLSGANGTGWRVTVDNTGMNIPLPQMSGNLMVWVPELDRFVREEPLDPEFWIKPNSPEPGQYQAKHGASTYTGSWSAAT